MWDMDGEDFNEPGEGWLSGHSVATIESLGTLGGVSQSVSLTGHYVDSWGHWGGQGHHGVIQVSGDLVEGSAGAVESAEAVSGWGSPATSSAPALTCGSPERGLGAAR